MTPQRSRTERQQTGTYLRQADGALYGADGDAAEVLRAAVKVGTSRTSGLSGVAMTRAEAELTLRALWRDGYRLVPR